MSNQVVVIQQQKLDPISFGFVPVMILCGITALIIAYFWQIVTVLAISGAVFLLYRHQQIKREEQLQLSQRAVMQNEMFLAGDRRGMVGVFDGEELEASGR